MAEMVRVVLRGGSYDGEERELTREQALVTLDILPDGREVYVLTKEVEHRNSVSLPVYRYDPHASTDSAP